VRLGSEKIRLNKVESSVWFDRLEKMESCKKRIKEQMIKKVIEMVQKYFIDSWLLPYSLRSHRTANPTPKNGLRHFSALPTHHPAVVAEQCYKTEQQRISCNFSKMILAEYGIHTL